MKLINSIYWNYLINYFALNGFIILLYTFDYKQLVIDLALFGSFVILLCQIFSFNSRTLLLSINKTVDVIPILLQRLVLSLIIILICNLSLPFFIYENRSLASTVMIALIVNWIYEIILTKIELEKNNLQKFHFILGASSFILICFSFYINNFLLLKIVLILYSLLIFLKILQYLIYNIYILNDKKYSLKTFVGIHFISSFGSSLSISISNFLFRYFIIILSTLETSSAVIIGFMFGSLPVSLFYNIFGASLVRNKINLNVFKKYFFYFLIIFFILTFFLTSKLGINYFFNFFHKNNILLITIILSILGTIPMLIGLYNRQKIIQETSFKDKFFNLDIIYSLAVTTIVPLIYIINNELFFSFCFLLSGLCSYIFFSLSSNLKNKKLINLFLFLIPLPIFFIILDTFKKFNFLIINQNNLPILEDLYSLPIPLSLMIMPLLLVSLLHLYQYRLVSIYVFTLSFLTGILSIVYLQRLTFSNFLNIIQFFLPMFGLIIGEIIGKVMTYKKLFFKNLYLISVIVIFLQIILTLIQGNDRLVSNVFGFHIYQNINFTSTVFFLGLFFQLSFNSFKNLRYILIKDYILLILILIYFYYANSISLYLFVLFFILYFLILQKVSITLNSVILSFLILSFYFSNINLDILTSELQVIFKSNKYFLETSLENYISFLFGKNLNNELYLTEVGVFNFYLDYIYNFGFISFVPFVYLVIYTIHKTIKYKDTIFRTNINYVLFYLFLFIIFIDSFLRTGLKQPFIGIIYYIMWGIYLSKLHKKNQ